VLAWADVANQVAHAIKNPLTPLRLGIQHLRRVRDRRPEHFDTALDETSERLLAEIDRLDAIARGFSRFAAPVESDAPLGAVELKPVAEEVAGLHHLAPGLRIRVEIPSGVVAQARRDELKEVLLNLCDNARNAGAGTVVIRWEDGALLIRDDGRGIPPDVLPRIFEPRFSTTSSGSGLGLAIVRRVVEGWGAGITVQSTPGKGAEFAVRFPPVQRNPSAASTQ
jgi:signal transduction histidine kinase